MHTQRKSAALMPYILFYAFNFMAIAVFSTYINIYFMGIGFSIKQIGFLSAIGPAVSLVAQPLWGLLSDRTNNKRVLIVIIGGAIIATLLFPLNTAFLFICMTVMFYQACATSVEPLGDTITLQFLKSHPIVKFSSIRLVGTISYALMAAVMGRVLTGDLSLIFFISAFILMLALLSVWRMPMAPKTEDKIENGNPALKKQKASLGLLFKNPMLVCIFMASFVFGLTLSFHYSFVGLRLQELGADANQIGFSMSLAAISEIPILLIIHKVFGNKKPVHILMFTGFAMGLRMLIIFAGDSILAVYVSQLLNGLTFMVPYYFSVLLVDQHSPEGLKSTAQSLCTVFRSGAAALLGNIGGGFMADAFGIRGVYWVLAMISFGACVLLPGCVLLIHRVKRTRRPQK